MGNAKDFKKWMKEEDKRKKNYKFEPLEIKKEIIIKNYNKKPYQLDLFEEIIS